MDEEELIKEAWRIRDGIDEFMKERRDPPDFTTTPGDPEHERDIRDQIDWHQSYEQEFAERFEPKCRMLLEEFEKRGIFEDYDMGPRYFEQAFELPAHPRGEMLPAIIDELVEKVRDR